MYVLVTCKNKIKRIRSKATEKRWRHHFPHYKSMGAFCCHGHQSFDPICLKTLCSLSPPPVMLHIKFYHDWPTGCRDIQVRKCKIFVIQGHVQSSRIITISLQRKLRLPMAFLWEGIFSYENLLRYNGIRTIQHRK